MDIPTKKYPTLVIEIKVNRIKRLATLLQRGFLIPCSRPLSLYDLLSELPGFDHDYITSRIETIFINGSAGDSLDQILMPGNRVALSAAMPGLAGAIFRKGGMHASLRSKPVPASPHRTEKSGFITLKLFNTTAADMVEPLLKSGILIQGSVLARFFVVRGKTLHSLFDDIRQRQNLLSVGEATQLAKSHPVIFLKIQAR